MTAVMVIFLLIYLLTILLAATELVPLSLAALIGALFTAWFGLSYNVFTYEEALNFIDMRLLFLIIGAMIVVEVAEKNDLFRFAALYAIKLAGGSPIRLFITLNLTAAAVSLFLSDPMAMLLMAAAITTITKLLGYDPIPYFVSSAVMINLGGTSTLIGSVSNMIIGVEANLSFSDFISYLSLCELILYGLTLTALYFIFRSRMRIKKKMPPYDPWESVKDKGAFYKSALILILFIVLFVLLDMINVGPESVALGCAVLALAVSNVDPADIFRRIDWETIFFIAGILFLVSGIEKTGVLSIISTEILKFSGGSSFYGTLLTLWLSGVASIFVSNIAVAATFTPVIKGLSGLNTSALWSALILGTNLGGATTPMSGAVPAMALGAMKREGLKIKFSEFTKVGVVTTLIQLGFASIYLIFRFGLAVFG